MAEHDDHAEGHGHGDPDPEIRPPMVFKILAVLVATAIGFGLLMLPFVGGLKGLAAKRGVDSSIENVRPTGPRLQADPEGDLDRFQHAEQELLDSYGWTDRSAQLARIPVERAKELMLQAARDGGAVDATESVSPATEDGEADSEEAAH